jgi:hypothetical protein
MKKAQIGRRTMTMTQDPSPNMEARSYCPAFLDMSPEEIGIDFLGDLEVS